MSRDEMVEALGTIARSGTKAFMDRIEAAQGRRGRAADRPVRRRLLFRLHGRRTASTWSRAVPAPTRPGCGRRTARAPSRSRPQHSTDAPARGTRVILHLMEDAKTYTERSTLERIVKAQSGHVPVPIVDRRQARRRSRRDRRRRGAVDQAEVRDHSRGLHRLLPQRRRPVRRAGADDPFPRRGAPRIHRARLRAGLAAVRPVRSRPQGADEALRQARLHHRRGGDPAALSALRARPGRFRRPAAQRLARDDPGEPDPRRDQEGRDQPRARRPREARREATPDAYAKIWETFGAVLKEGLYEDFERRDALLGLARFKTTARRRAWRSLKDYVAALKENQTAIYYIAGDDLDAARSLAAARRLPRARHRGAAAAGSGRQLLGHVRRRLSRASRSSR